MQNITSKQNGAVDDAQQIEPAKAKAPLVQSEGEQNTTLPKEIGGRKQGPEPTRYGDWEKNGRCIDF